MSSKRQQQDDYWDNFVDALAEAILILDASGVIVYANQAAYKLLEKKPSSMVGELFSYPFESEQSTEIEIITSHQSIRYADLNIKAGKWRSKDAWIATLHDITLMKHNEEALKIAANVFNYAKEGIVITDEKGVIIDVNQEFTHITQYSKDEVMGQKMSLLQSGKYKKSFYEKMWSSLASQGYWYGQIWNKKKNGEIYPQLEAISVVRDEVNDVTNYVSVFYDMTKEEANKRKLQYMANYDSLTGLPNRELFTDRLEQAMLNTKRTKDYIALIFIDLNDFKVMNDTFGHHFGDLVLKKFTDLMNECIRETDTFARYGGDEFILLLTDIKYENHYQVLFDRINEQLKNPVSIQSHTVHLSASMGITFYPQKKELSAEQLIRQADQAMYTNKITGSADLTIFDVENELYQKEENQLINELRAALQSDEFELYYQPKVNMRTHKIIGVEGLLRWHHPVHGLLLPDNFLPKIKHSEFFIELSMFTIRQALEQLEIWHKQGIELTISVNINPFEFEQTNFITHIQQLISPYSKKIIQCLEFEILESSTISNMQQATRFVEQFKNLGIKFSLDDFGTGYSSINHLVSLPFDYMKIDIDFIRNILDNPRDIKIIKAILAIAQAVHIDVIAEGVETVAHQVLLLELGCIFGQGYVFSPALSIRDFNAWYQTWIKASHLRG